MKAEAVQPDKEGGYWQVVEKRIDFLEGAQFAACLFSSLSKKRPPIHSYRKSEQHTDRYFPTVCMLFFLLYRLFRRSLVSAAVSLPCTDVKGERFSG